MSLHREVRRALGSLRVLARLAWLTCAVVSAGLFPSSALAAFAPAPGNPTNNGSQQTAYGPIASGAGYQDTLESPDELEYYSFYAEPSDRVTIALSEPTGFVDASVFDEDGEQVCSGATNGQPATCVPGNYGSTASHAGVYYLVVAAGDAVTPDSYTVSVTGSLYDYNPVKCSAAQARVRRAQAAASKDLRAARKAKKAHHRKAYRRALAAYHREKRALAGDDVSAHAACTG